MTDKDITKYFNRLYIKLLDVKYDLKITHKEFLALNEVHNLVYRQQSKIDDLMERTVVTTLIDDAVVYTPTLEDYNKFKKKFKSEAVKEFADKVVCDIDTYCEKNIRTKPSVDGVTGMKIAHNLIYKRLREMEGENNGNG